MRWRNKYIEEKKPEHGDYRIIYRFAWWPKKLKGATIWLEKYKRIEEFVVRFRYETYPNIGIAVEGIFGRWELREEKPIAQAVNIDRCEHSVKMP